MNRRYFLLLLGGTLGAGSLLGCVPPPEFHDENRGRHDSGYGRYEKASPPQKPQSGKKLKPESHPASKPVSKPEQKPGRAMPDRPTQKSSGGNYSRPVQQKTSGGNYVRPSQQKSPGGNYVRPAQQNQGRGTNRMQRTPDNGSYVRPGA